MADGMFDPGVADLATHNTASQGSPLFDFLTAFAPRKLKDLFRLCEYLYFNSSQIYAALHRRTLRRSVHCYGSFRLRSSGRTDQTLFRLGRRLGFSHSDAPYNYSYDRRDA